MKLRNLSFWRLSVLPLVLFSACTFTTDPSDTVKQDRIYQRYVATYNESSNKTTLEAHFRNNDSSSTFELVGSSTVAHLIPAPTATDKDATIQGVRMEKKSMRLWGTQDGTYYEGVQNGFQPINRFRYENNDKPVGVFTNNVTIPKIAMPAVASLRATVESNGSVIWSGLPIQNDEQVVLSLTVQSPGATHFREGESKVVGQQSVTLPDDWKRDVKPGMGTLSLRRTLTKPLEMAPSEEKRGEMIGTYITREVKVEVIIDGVNGPRLLVRE